MRGIIFFLHVIFLPCGEDGEGAEFPLPPSDNTTPASQTANQSGSLMGHSLIQLVYMYYLFKLAWPGGVVGSE